MQLLALAPASSPGLLCLHLSRPIIVHYVEIELAQTITPSIQTLSRVFPISLSYYLARLLFTQSPSTPFARILIGMEAHSEEEYEQHVRPFRGHEWPNGLLHFSLYDDETSQETTNNVSTQQDGEDVLMGDSHGSEGAHRRLRRHEHRHGHHHGHHPGHHRDHPRRDFPPWPHHRSPFVAPPPPPFMPPFPPPPHTPPSPPPPPPPPPFFRSFFHSPSPPMPPSLHQSSIVVPPSPLLSPHVAHPAPPLPSLPSMQPASQDDARQQSPPPTVDATETPVQRFYRHRGLRSVSSAPVLGPTFPIPARGRACAPATTSSSSLTIWRNASR
ncbi:hypothetical protein F5888DRAFT_1800837 [Russula emetica]|nr:hypothetical protein F5888DRAFT_1800837 [Russula emetica]